MKVKYLSILILCLISQISTLAYTGQDVVHIDSEFAKVCPLEDGNVLVLSTVLGLQKTKISKFDKKNARPIYENAILEKGYTGSAEVVEFKSSNENEQDYHLFYHNKQNLPGHESKQVITSFDDLGKNVKNKVTKNSLYQKTSVVSLKNGKIIIAGINYLSSFGAETSVEVNIYDPKTDTYGNGFSFPAHSNYISCYEQRDNDVYCVYVSYEDIFLSKLKIRRLKLVGNNVNNCEDERVIKVFYTVFNFLKVVKFNDNEAIILFQTGNGNKEVEFGNTGKDLYYYHILVEKESKDSCCGFVSILRYEYLYNQCIYRDDPEYYNADIIALSQKRIYAVCEYEENKFYGFAIYTDKKAVDRFTFNNFEASGVKNPVFTKFDKNLALFYTHKTPSYNSRTVYMMINYPDCNDYRQTNILLPRHRSKELDLEGKVFMMNAYPANRQYEEIKVRIVQASNMNIINTLTNEKVLLNQDFDPSINLKFTPEDIDGVYSIEYTATREDPLDGLILGRTCKITFETPECLPQCYTCAKKGTEEHNYCITCRNESYYPILDPGLVIDGISPLYNCTFCNDSCTSCYGPFYETPKPPSTNCKRCNYEENYFPFEGDNKTCISTETQDYWEIVIGSAIFLDKSGGEQKEKWIWRRCHHNCKKCDERGDDIDNKCIYCVEPLYFFCNQTVGNGIPGSCHSNCVNNGFYEKIDEGRKKCCPCLDHCKVCQNETKCDHCFPEFYRTPDAEHCDKDCGYCLAKDDSKWECVNCKDSQKYNLDGRCIDTLPSFNYFQYDKYLNPKNVTKKYHIIDDKCNLIDACQEGCQKCSKRFSDNCTLCQEGYYREDPFKFRKSNFHCYSMKVCQGVENYPNNNYEKVGGVPIEENEENVCLNCKLRNNSFRLPEDDFYCGEKIDRTYVDIDEYNKLSYCYFRCKSCNNWGNAYLMNCTACRDGKHYDLIQYNGKKGLGNCYRKAHKCGIYPYYHDYELAKNDDDCGEDCDVCLYNFTCTEKFPYFVYETHECVEYCPITEILGNKCYMNNSIAGIILLRNPFGLKNPYDFLNKTVTINEFISSSLFQYFASSYNLDMNTVENQINNYLGNGKIYNLPESQIIVGNNISIELTTFKLELEKLKKLIGGGKTPTTSVVDLSACEAILKKKYDLSDEEDLMIIKGDLLEQLSEEYLGNSIEYQIFSTSLGAFLPLNDCQEAGTTVSVSNPFSVSNLLTQYQSKIDSVIVSGYNGFDVNSPFYNDICTPFTNENGNDVLLDDRRKDYFNENVNLCEKECVFVGYNISTNLYTCLCNIKVYPGEKAENYTGDYVTNEIPENFRDMISKRSNIEVFKCASQVFSSSGQKMNFGSYIILVGLATFIGVIVFHFIKEKTKMDDIFYELSSMPSNPANPPNPKRTKEDQKSDKKTKEKKHKDNKDKKVIVENKGKTTKEPFSRPKKNPTNIQREVVLKDDQLNFASYNIALKNDKRSFIRYYWSLLKMKQLCIFTFYTSEDYILRSTKIALFILFISFYLAFTALFFNDSIMRAIYIYKGNTNAAIHIPNIILSSLCSIIMSLIVRFVSLNERDIVKITQESNPENRRTLAEKARRISKIKLIILYAVSGALIALCWYYVSAFCAVFKNSQGHYFINFFVAFIVCNIWPCVTSLIPAFLRQTAINKGTSETLYKVSQIISLF